MAKIPTEFDDRETATVGACLRAVEAMRSRYRAGIMDAAEEVERYLESNYGIVHRQAAPKVYRKRSKS